MKKLIQFMVVLSCVMLMCTSAWSFSKTDHVSTAQNGKGDVLVYPLYMVLDGSFQTKIQVINTKDDASAVAKVVIRSPLFSFEVRDFLIFLSPTDAWEGTLKMKDGQVVIYSEDDSTLTSTVPTFASSVDPFDYALEDVACDTNGYGYAEVQLAAVYKDDLEFDEELLNLTKPQVNKEDIYTAFIGKGSIDNPQPIGAVRLPSEVSAEYRNILAGNFQIETAVPAWTSALNAMTMKDYQVSSALSPKFDSGFGKEARNTIGEVEAALAKNDVGMPYYNDEENGVYSLHFFNFPTKLVTELNSECVPEVWRGEYTGFPKVDVDYTGYDMAENTKVTKKPIVSPYPDEETTTFDYELSLHVPQTFIQGWYRYNFPAGPTTDLMTGNNEDVLEYDGAPVIPLALNFGERGLSMQYGFWNNTDVKINGEKVPGYQYTSGYVTTTD